MEKLKQNKLINIIMIGSIAVIIAAIVMLFIINTGKISSEEATDPSAGNTSGTLQGKGSGQDKTGSSEKSTGIKVTFVELGSVRCIPCKMMQPVIKAIEEKYPDTVKVIFYDVWTEEGKPYGATYNIKAIPTQVFLDSNGKEYFRHEGFFPQEEVEKILKMKL